MKSEQASFELLYLAPAGNIFRFIYDGGDNVREGTFFKARLAVALNRAVSKIPLTRNAIITALIGTGKDNLEGGDNNNVNLFIHFKDSPAVITIENINKNAKWNNHTVHTVKYEIPNSGKIDIFSISKISMRHTGGGGPFADNWDLTDLKLTIKTNNDERLLADERASSVIPIHRFTGEARIKEFTAWPEPFNESYKNSVFVTAVFGTGADNLEGGQNNNVDINFRIDGDNRIYGIGNVNGGEKWESYSVHSVSNIQIRNSEFWDLSKHIRIQIMHTGGKSSFDDTWDLDKLKIIITKSGKSIVLKD